jgi:hypothetical protein
MQILTMQSGRILGPFTTVTSQGDDYLCDGTLYELSTTGPVTITEVADGWVNPINTYNASQQALRQTAYQTQSDPLFFRAQRGEIDMQKWIDAVESIKQQYPYKI